MILVFGTTGQVAREIARHAGPRRLTQLSRAEADLGDPGACAAQILRHRPDAVINAAAYTAVDRAEEDEALAHDINARAPAAMAQTCANMDIPLVQISTDYVFAGTGDAPHAPDDATDPQNAYGRTKLAGEDAIRATTCRHAILRTSWVFSEHGGNFVKTMLRLADTRDSLTVVGDQHGGPTSAAAIARACLTLADRLIAGTQGGTFHFAGAPDTTWADFARAIFDIAGRDVAVTDIATADYPTPASRPLNSRLDCSSLQAAFGIARPDWRSDLTKVIRALT